MKFNVFQNVQIGHSNRVSTLDIMVDVMKTSQRLKKLCNEYQNSIVNQNIKKANRIKKTKTPVFAPCALMYGGKGRTNVIGLTGYGVIDIDHIKNEQIDNAFEILKEDPHIVLAVRSISNHGIHLIYQYEFTNIDMPKRVDMDPNKMNKTYISVGKAVMAYYNKLLKLPIDKECLNAERLMILSHDPNLIYNPNAKPFILKFDYPKISMEIPG